MHYKANLYGIEISLPATRIGVESDGTALAPKLLEHAVERHAMRGRIDLAQKELMTLSATSLRQAFACRVKNDNEWSKTIYTTIALSNELEEGTCAFDQYNRLHLPAEWARSMDWDCDGDPVQVFLMAILPQYPEGTPKEEMEPSYFNALIAKQPVKTIMPTLRVVDLPLPIFAGLSDDLVESERSKKADIIDWYAVMTKAFSEQPIGLITKMYWSKMLLHTMGHSNLIDGMVSALKTIGAEYRDDLEGKTMKGVRGQKEGTLLPSIFSEKIGQMSDITSVVFGTKSACSKVFLTPADLRDIHIPKFEKARPYKQPNRKDMSWTSRPKLSCESLISRLIELGRIRINPLDANDNGYGPIEFSLLDPSGNQCSFVWTKSNGESVSGYVAVIYPTFAYNPITRKGEAMSPLFHLSLWFSRHFKSSTTISTNKYVEMMLNGDSTVGIEGAFRDYIQVYGEGLPSVQTGDRSLYTLHPTARYFAQQTVQVDHASFMGWDKNVPMEIMMQSTMSASAAFGGINLFSPGNSRELKRHFINEKGRMFPSFIVEEPTEDGLSYNFGQAHRVGRNSSLLRRCIKHARLRVAIVHTGSNIQYYMTPSGIQKTTPEIDTFLPQVSFEQLPGYTLKQFPKFNGKMAMLWISPTAKREAKTIGKFLCVYGSRFEPTGLEQCYQDDGTEVDLVIPFEELSDNEKKLATLFLRKSTKGSLKLADGTVVDDVYFCDHTFFRSGAASENIKARTKSTWSCDGFMSLVLAASLKEAGYTNFTNFDKKAFMRSLEYLQAFHSLPSAYHNSLKSEEVVADDEVYIEDGTIHISAMVETMEVSDSPTAELDDTTVFGTVEELQAYVADALGSVTLA
jgi:hypothetical protein